VPSSSIVNLAAADEFSTLSVVVVEVAPVPLTCSVELGVVVPIPTLPLLSITNLL